MLICKRGRHLAASRCLALGHVGIEQYQHVEHVERAVVLSTGASDDWRRAGHLLSVTPDQHEFERMFREHHDAVLAYALRRAPDHEARDVVAETFLVAWRRFDEAPSKSSLPWLYGVARRVLANQRRAARRRAALVDRLGTAASSSVGTECESTPLLDALAGLADGDREVLLLVAWEGLSAAQTAVALGCRPAAVRMRVHRARRRLAATLDGHSNLCPPTQPMESAS